MNEDSCGTRVSAGRGCWVVADGLGAHGGGDQASRRAVETVLALAEQEPGLRPEVLERHIAAAHQAIRRAQREEGPAAMHTTVAVVVSDLRAALWAHVGDSRVYFFRDGQVVHQTADHSVPQMLVDSGEVAPEDVRHHPDRSRLLRALGQENPPRPTVHPQPERLRHGDALLLCTDGWWEHVTETEMEIDLVKAVTPDHWLGLMMDRILERADGEHDNFTALGLFVTVEDPVPA